MVMGAFNRLLMASISIRGLSTTAVSSSPWLMLPSSAVAVAHASELEVRSLDYSFYRLSDKKTISLKNKGHIEFHAIPRDNFCFGSSNGWLLLCKPRNFALYLTNPLSPTPPKIRIADLKYFHKNPPWDVLPHQIIKKFSMSGSPESKDWRILIIFKEPQKLGFYNPLSGWRWIMLDNPQKVPYIEAIYSSEEKLFYTLNLKGEIEAWDLCDHENHKRVKAYQPVFNNPEFLFEDDKRLRDDCLCTKYLVESKMDILLVHRYSCSKNNNNNNTENGEQDPSSKTRRFDVYKLSKEKDSWEHVESLGDRVLFLGMNEPFSLSASDFPELKPNSIYFTGPSGDEGKYSSSDWGIYNLEDDTITCHYPCDYWLKIRPPPIWIDRSSTGTTDTSNDGMFNN